MFGEWCVKWDGYLRERTTDPETGKSLYTHKKLRSAYLSVRRNLPLLFTWYDNIKMGIPNTTNLIDGHFSQLKRMLCNHNGTHDNRLINNYIGTDYGGNSAVANTAGIIIDGISYKNIIDGNVISGNQQVGVGINITGSDSNVLVRNKIGVDAQGNTLPNGMDGIRISQGPKQTVIGGSPAEGNVIANNGGCGVYITNDNCKRNLISCNTFYNNGGLAIDLFSPGVNANDAGDSDDGANGKLNFPVISGIVQSGGGVVVEGTLDTRQPEQCEVQLYRAATDPTGHGEGRDYLASVTPSSNGTWSATLSGLSPDEYVTAIAIDSMGNTSEFSRCRNSRGSAGVGEAETTEIRVFPNPARGTLYIVGCKVVSSTVLDVAGKVVMRFGKENKIDVSKLPAGIYTIRIETPTAIVVRKIVVER